MAPPHVEETKVPFEDVTYSSLKETENILIDNTVHKNGPGSSLLLYLTACAATLTTLGGAAVVVWTSPTIVKLKSNNSDENPLGVPVTTFEVSLIGGLPMFGATVGALFLTKLCDVIGRKNTIMALSLMMFLANIVLAFARTLILYYICRFVSGLGVGAVISVVSIFFSEISEDHNRGKIGCLIGLSFPLGNLYSFVLGPIFSIRNFTLLVSLPFFLNLVAFVLFVPESPIYLASKNKKDAAIKALKKLRNKTISEIEQEYKMIIHTIESSSHTSDKGFKILLSTRGLRKGLLISIGCTMIQMLSGVVAIVAFAAPLFDAAGTKISGNTVAILIGIVKLMFVFLATVIIEKAGKRPLLLISTFGAGVSVFTLGTFFYLKSIHSPLIEYILWLPIPAVLIYFVFYGIGIGAIPQSLMSELFPSSVRAQAVSASSFMGMITGVVITMAFPVLNKAFGEMFCLWGFSASCFIGFVFLYKIMPEIKGKSPLEIQEILSR